MERVPNKDSGTLYGSRATVGFFLRVVFLTNIRSGIPFPNDMNRNISILGQTDKKKGFLEYARKESLL
jgi:hypothetical protein